MAAERVREFFLRWADLQGRQCVVSIVDTEVLSGGTVELSAGLNPFVVSGDDDSDPLCAIRLHPAQIGVRDNYTLLGRFEFTSVTRYRVQCRREGGIVWQGWLKCDALSQSYSSVKDEIILDCIDDIEALKAFDVSASDWDKELPSGPPVRFEGRQKPVSIMRMLCECVAHVSHIVGGDGLAFSFSNEVGLPNERFWQLLVNKGVFFEESEIDIEDEESVLWSPMTCYEALEEICTFAGFTCQQVGGVVYFTSSIHTGKHGTPTDWTLLLNPYAVVLVDMNTAEGLHSGGSHEVSVYGGVHKVCVRTERAVKNTLGMDIENGARLVEDEGIINSYPGKLKAFTLTNPRIVTRCFDMNCYAQDFGEFDITEMDYTPRGWFALKDTPEQQYIQTSEYREDYYAQGSCCVVKADVFEERDTNYNYKYGILTRVHYPTRYIIPYSSTDWYPSSWKLLGNSLPFAELFFGGFTFAGGALALNFTLLPVVGRDFDHIRSSVHLALSVGDYSFVPGENGAAGTWTNNGGEPLPFLAELNTERNQLKDTKTLSDPYNGAKGLVMPINGTLSGDVKLTLYGINPSETSMPSRNTSPAYIHTDISLKYHPTDADACFEPKAVVNYRAYSDKWADESITKSVLFHSMKDNVSDGGTLIKPATLQPLEQTLSWRGIRECPEEALLAKYKAFYFNARKVVTLELEDDLTFPCIYTDESGERWQLLCCVGYDYARGVGRWLFVNLINVQ